jgi:heme exporter protein C
MHALANPARFLRIARPATAWLLGLGLLLAIAGIAAGLLLTPADYLQGETVRILYVHVPAAWLGMGGWTGIAAASLSQLVWRHPLAAVAGRAIAPAGATFAFICLATGSIWGRPTWGTWWEWDGRLTSMLVLFFMYLGYIALAAAERDRGGEGRLAAIYGLVGAINLPIIHYSVLWWRTLHQGLYRPVRGRRTDADARRSCRGKGRGAAAPGGGGMNPWPFVTAAYGVTILATGLLLLWAWRAMRRSEARVEELKRR